MSSTTISPDSVAVAAQQSASNPPPSKAPSGSSAEGASKATTPDVQVETSLREPIRDVAEQADSHRAESLQSITKVADDIEEAIDTLNDALAKAPTKAMISHDNELNRYIVRIADERSGEVIREIPSEAVLKFARNLREIKGLLFDQAL